MTLIRKALSRSTPDFLTLSYHSATMPRTSPFPIHLSASETAELRRRSTKYTLSYFQVQRAKGLLHRGKLR
jgi:hypothetical protein